MTNGLSNGLQQPGDNYGQFYDQAFPDTNSLFTYNNTQPLSHLPHHSPGAPPDLEISVLPKFPPQNFDIPDIETSNSIGGGSQTNIVTTTTVYTTPNLLPNSYPSLLPQHPIQNQAPPPPHLFTPPSHPVSHFSGHNMVNPRGSQQKLSPPGSNTTSPSRDSCEDSSSDDSLPLAQVSKSFSSEILMKLPSYRHEFFKLCGKKYMNKTIHVYSLLVRVLCWCGRSQKQGIG